MAETPAAWNLAELKRMNSDLIRNGAEFMGLYDGAVAKMEKAESDLAGCRAKVDGMEQRMKKAGSDLGMLADEYHLYKAKYDALASRDVGNLLLPADQSGAGKRKKRKSKKRKSKKRKSKKRKSKKKK